MTQPNSPVASPPSVPPTGTEATAPGRRLWRRLRAHRMGLAGLVVLALIVAGGLLAPLISPHDPGATHLEAIYQRPFTVGYGLGTDDLGRDILSRVLHGVRASLLVGALALAISLAVGVPAGLLAGRYRPADLVVSRLTDLVLAFPFLLFAVGVAAVLGPSLWIAAIAIGVSHIPSVVRVTRVETLRIGQLDFVLAARVQGAGDARVFTRYVLPNALSALIVQATVIMPTAVLSEALLSFLGLGIQPPTPSLGGMLSDAQQYASTAPWAAIAPGVAIALICLAFNTLGDALRDALDVTTGGPAR
ncbi:ABC transporter permease [Streptomyces sp. DSM 44915]|uniref:ABC transporter permease n=1 Tax=Streptomyces chisholmiae TaxID=3075540 RepID=A0ABU2JMR8_9ACTN|nr:ABC transporter permease [Streptomyces sp. DSM 44915]MDT0265989.1 ABC transporter permease [Streptomyces sp. DSM 44915]